MIRDGLPLCTSITTVILYKAQLTHEELECLLPAFYITSVRILSLWENNIQEQCGGKVIRNLLFGNVTLLELILCINAIHQLGACGLGQGLAGNDCLQKLNIRRCEIHNDGLEQLVAAMGETINNSLLDLNLALNRIQGAKGGQQLCLLLQCFPKLKVLNLHYNNLGPLGARALSPGLAAASHLEELDLDSCQLGNDGVAKLIPDGQENRSLTNLNLGQNNIQGAEGGGQVSLLLQHFPALKVLDLHYNRFLGPLGVSAFAPGLAAASHLEALNLSNCRIGNDGVANLIPAGQINRSLTSLDITWNDVQGTDGGESVVSLTSCCINLDSINVGGNILSPDQQRCVDKLSYWTKNACV